MGVGMGELKMRRVELRACKFDPLPCMHTELYTGTFSTWQVASHSTTLGFSQAVHHDCCCQLSFSKETCKQPEYPLWEFPFGTVISMVEPFFCF